MHMHAADVDVRQPTAPRWLAQQFAFLLRPDAPRHRARRQERQQETHQQPQRGRAPRFYDYVLVPRHMCAPLYRGNGAKALVVPAYRDVVMIVVDDRASLEYLAEVCVGEIASDLI